MKALHEHMEKALWQGCAMRLWRPLRAEAGWNNVMYPVTRGNVSPGAERAGPQGLHRAALVGTGSAWEKQRGGGSSHANGDLTLGAKECAAMPNSHGELEARAPPPSGPGLERARREAGPLRAPRGARAALPHTAAGRLVHPLPGFWYRKGTQPCSYKEITPDAAF